MGRGLHRVRWRDPLAPVTFSEWARREGGEERRQRFENDYRDYLAGRATPEQVERVRYAFADVGSVLDEADD